ncbi:MAG: T9SS type A sorting domain-containing protein [bacterium]|nr:T9SS type A sorting domain-containing protein [bacterium]
MLVVNDPDEPDSPAIIKIREGVSPYAYPNPFKPTTTHQGKALRFAGLSGSWKIEIYTVAGEMVKDMSGNDTVAVWDGADAVASGVYLYVITDGTKLRRLVR